MPLIIGYNISPTASRKWRAVLAGVIESVTKEFWEFKGEEVDVFFPHDPSVPTRPYPPAFFIVEGLFEKPDRTDEKRQVFAEQLGIAIRGCLNRFRRRKDSRVKVLVKRFDPDKDGFADTLDAR